jgi:hypothetical protein
VNSAGNKVFYAKWTVAVTNISLNKTTITLLVNATEQLTEIVTPNNAADKTVTWSSSDESVATVTNGLVTAISLGISTIRVATNDGNYIATCAVTVALSNDATLSGLAVSVGRLTPAFNSDITSYTVNVSTDVTSIDVTGTVNYSAATVSGNITGKTLDEGNNVVNIIVTAADGTTKTYVVTIIRTPAIQSKDLYLIRLSANGNDIAITETDLEYIAGCGELEVVFDKIEVSQYADYKIDGAKYTGQAIPLAGDVTTINIQVVAETGGAVKDYTLKVTKSVYNNTLYYQRWSEVLAINLNPATNGGYNIEGVRWYGNTGSIVSDEGYIRLQGRPASDYYAEIKVANEWHHVCGTAQTRGISEIKAYPNPVPRGETVKLQLPDEFIGGYLNIFVITGELVKSKLPLPAKNNSINVIDLPSGVYLLNVTSKTGNTETVKIIIE